MDKPEIVARVRSALQEVMALRASCNASQADSAARYALKSFQSARMAATHADLLAEPRTTPAARFFLDDLYGVIDTSKRDTDLERVIPIMARMLPAKALDTIAQAVVLDALSESLDMAMAAELGPKFTEAEYLAAYVRVTAREDRRRQLTLVDSVGKSLSEVVDIPLIGSTIKMMRTPAKVARLAELHHFLERGFKAFKGLKAPREFVATIIDRETRIMQRIYGGEGDPFAI